MNELNKPTHACPIKVTDTSARTVQDSVWESISAGEIADENNKTGKVTAIVAVMYLINDKKVNLRSLSPQPSIEVSWETVEKSSFFGKGHEISRKKREKAGNWQEKANGKQEQSDLSPKKGKLAAKKGKLANNSKKLARKSAKMGIYSASMGHLGTKRGT